MHCLYCTFVAVDISFDQSSYFASETEGFMTVTLVSSQPVEFPYSIAVSLLQSTPVSAEGKNFKKPNLIHAQNILCISTTPT